MSDPQTTEIASAVPLIHLIPQQMWHDDANIIGTLPALMILRDCIDRAMSSGAAAMGGVANDGEGYWLGVACVTPEEMSEVPLGYASAEAEDPSPLPLTIEARITRAVRALIESRRNARS